MIFTVKTRVLEAEKALFGGPVVVSFGRISRKT
jgi:hypothetical protein